MAFLGEQSVIFATGIRGSIFSAIVLILVATAMGGGCASNITTDEREMQRFRDYERWQICREAYRIKGGVWFSNYHLKRNAKPKHHQVKSDLTINECRRVLGKHWD